MNKMLIAILAIACLYGQQALAIQMASPKLSKIVKACSAEEDELADATCRAFVLGVSDSTAFYVNAQSLPDPFCVPDGTEQDALVAAFRDFLDENRSLRRYSPGALAVSALKQAFPCE